MPHRLDLALAQPLFDVAATRRIEQAAQATLPPHTLMQRAGLATARLALALAPHARTVWIACGPGNNGGDGFEAALHLKRWGGNPLITWLGDEARAPADARASLARARDAGVRFADAPTEPLGAQDLCIDALLGIGAARAPEGRMAAWLARMAQGPAQILAVDTPTGLDADRGLWHAANGPDLIANHQDRSPTNGPFDSEDGTQAAPRHTLTLLTLKPGLLTGQGRDAAGTLWFDDLGVTPTEPPTAWLNGAPTPRPRPHASHKGRFGDVAVIGGATQADGASMAGAALLAGSAALHGGAGRVFVSLLGATGAPPIGVRPELMFRPPAALDLGALTVVCGCGGGAAVAGVLPAVLRDSPRLVLDADALNAVAADAALRTALRARAGRGQPGVLTPHPLEAARLLGCSAADVQADRLGSAHRLADELGAVVVLKGSGSVIAAPGQPPRINASGNARLAAPGTGDVLAGLIGARLTGGLDSLGAACAAVFEHGAAADAWPPQQALTAGALAARLRP